MRLRTIAPWALIAIASCRDVAELEEELNGELIVAHAPTRAMVRVVLDGGSALTARASDTSDLRFRFRLDPGEHEGEIRVEPTEAEPRCGRFELEIEERGDRDSAVVDARDLEPCEPGEGEGEGEEGEGEGEEGEGEGEEGEGEGEEGEGEGEEGEGEGEEGEGEGEEGEGEGEPPACVPGDPCDDGADCTYDDRCQPTGVCAGQVSDVTSCTCADTCDDSNSCCLVPDNCEASVGLCVTECDDGSCECHDSVCAAALQGETLTCEGEATCRAHVSGTSASALQCREGATCVAEVDHAEIAEVDCDESRCHVDADDAAFLSVECRETIACDVSARGEGEVHLLCEAASCEADCRDGSCELECGQGADCRLACADTSECSLSCASSSASCELDCGAPEACAAGTTCSCPAS